MYHIEPQKEGNRVWKGMAAAEGLYAGPVYVYNTQSVVLSDRKIASQQVSEEQKKVASAMRIVELETRKMAQLAAEDEETGGRAAKDVLNFHREVLRDPQLIAEVNERIRTDLISGDRAIFLVFRNYIQKLEVSGSTFFKERIPDIVDIRSRLINSLQQKDMIVQVKEDSIVVSQAINPSEIILFARRKVKGIVAERGGLTTHATIIAKSMGIPFVLEVEGITKGVQSGEWAVVDGYKGIVVTQPTPELVAAVREASGELAIRQTEEQNLYAEPGMTACGYQVPIRVNIELEAEIDRVARFRPEGVGLLRTEVYFLDGSHAASEAEAEDQAESPNGSGRSHDQTRFLQRAAQLAGDDYLTVRLYDVGADKLPSYAQKEENPALGWRGVRILLENRSLLRAQLRLILEAVRNYPCKLRLLIPLVTSLEDVLEVRAELDTLLESFPHMHPELGIMVEVPSAVVMVEALAEVVDFMSIGTNDLTQYALAADRSNPKVAGYFNSAHPAIWRLIHQVVKACKKRDIMVSVCGELAANPQAACILTGLGVSSLSMAGPYIPGVKKILRSHTLELMEKQALSILKVQTRSEAEKILLYF
ncbi:phosphoenolpyruvate--protein phosphotransferase [Cyclonatronum proteinivorum]|uniref:Phosphoenolpyruvate-protein phosphotransferase n=1 Tax=Cyclonatronum proteinivorum TaxID=1457365 RepID=A0A345UNA0_9BACT|nr:phosphoenolpyruvate--protein phosphotransferase [Cyclonatronum proteinivorum]AXJ01952.1 phosphoenolpyruvate--protein phosphotransferase [Cyclonatronum proteinivorum]